MTIDIRKQFKKYMPHLLGARDNNLTEGDTVVRIIKVFEDVFMYDPFNEITRELAIKERFVDIAIKIDGNVELLIEVKAAGLALRDKHIEQAQNYASHKNITWVLLTNGLHYILYHLTFDEGIEYDKVFDVDLEKNFDEACKLLSVLHKKSLAADGLEDYWEHSVALAPESIGSVLFSEEVLAVLRRELRKKADIKVSEEGIVSAITNMFSVATRELIGAPRIRRKRKKKVGKAVTPTGKIAVESEEIIITESVIETV